MLDVPTTIDSTDALSQPTRAHLFRLLGELGRPATTVELAERLDLHANGVRVHLDRLERDGLLIRTTERRPRGRPRDRWTIAPDARPGGQPPRGYRDLARWLSRAITPGRPSLRTLETTGRAIGRELAPAERQSQPSQDLIASLAALGFQPHIQTGDPGDFTVCLDNCPYSEVVTENQAAICTLHRGITRGLLDVLEPQARLTAFEPHDPRTAGCIIRITGIARAATQA